MVHTRWNYLCSKYEILMMMMMYDDEEEEEVMK